MQMQWKHQVRPPGMSYGVAITFSKEVLRTLQDFLPFYEAVCAKYAKHVANPCLRSAYGSLHLPECSQLGASNSRDQCLGLLAAFHHESSLVLSLLGQR